MSRQRRVRELFVLMFVLMFGLVPVAAAQDKSKGKDKKQKPAPTGTPVLWREQPNAASLNLFWGPGGEAMKPDLSRVQFVREETGGYSKKYRVKDASGRTWVAKIGVEAQSETAASRIVWAAGYGAEITYLAPRATIEGKGTFENVRFEARPEEWDRLDIWKWQQNPFTGTRELQGLKVLMAMLENWDMKDDNNKVIYVPAADGRPNELRYIISDLGATFGKTDSPGSIGGWLRQVRGSRNAPADFAGDKFIAGVEGGKVRLDYEGKNSKLMRDVSVEDARWLGTHLAKLSDEQIADAFRAANYTPEQVRVLTQALRGRINELVNLK